MTRQAPLLIAFSGNDGAGKSTQIARLSAHLADTGHRVRQFWSRGGYTPGFEALKALVRRTSGRRVLPAAGRSDAREAKFRSARIRKTWLFLACLDLLVSYAVLVRWWRFRGQTVLLDRYLADTAVDFRLNFPEERVERWRLWRLVTRLAPRPNAAVFLRVPVDVSLERCSLKNEPFPDSPERLADRLAQYDSLTGGYTVIDATPGVDAVFASIVRAMPAGAAP